MEQMTLQQAKDAEYKYATLKDGEGRLVYLTDLNEEDVITTDYLLVKKTGRPFVITDDCIQDLLQDHICSQDEVNDEDDVLIEAVAEVDYTEITNKVNEVLSKHVYYYSEEIKLIPAS